MDNSVMDGTGESADKSAGGHLAVLDGWRAFSILAVLAAHLLPLWPSHSGVNDAVALVGMAIFFTLSGFLITNILLRDSAIGRFLVRRIARIVPLAWTALVLSLPLQGTAAPVWIANLGFYANLPPFHLAPWSTHFWSLGVEMQFYAAIALVVLLLGRRGLWLAPGVGLAITALRVNVGAQASIVTWLRADEILAGATLALVVRTDFGGRWRRVLARAPFWPVALLAMLSADPRLGWLDYARPYLIAAMVGITIQRRVHGLSPLLASPAAAYIATISYALYIIHPFTVVGWLGEGKAFAKYAKRPLCFAITFGFGHLSTFHFERFFNNWAHQVTRRRSPLAEIQ